MYCTFLKALLGLLSLDCTCLRIYGIYCPFNEPLLFKFCLEILGLSAKFVCIFCPKNCNLFLLFWRISTHFMLCLHLTTAALVQSCWQQFISRWLFPILFKRKVAFTSETRNVSMIYRSKLKTNSFIAKIGTNPGFNLNSGLDLMTWFCPTHDQP